MKTYSFFKKHRLSWFQQAQQYELASASQFMDKEFLGTYNDVAAAKIKKDFYYHGENNDFFAGRKPADWRNFVDYCRDRSCLEIGAGPVGNILQWYWLRRRIVIDPLARVYQDYQKKKFGKTLFSRRIKIYNQPAEKFILDLQGKINGFILTRNTLDHLEDPLLALENISRYATVGCYLLFWCDLWHPDGVDEGHRQITKSVFGFKKLIDGLGFQIAYDLSPVRADSSTVEYGCFARKK